MKHVYITKGIDAQKCMDVANKELSLGYESILHYHQHGVECDFTTQNHKQFFAENLEEEKEDNEVTKLKERLSKAANMLDNYDSDRLPYEYMLEFNDFRTGLKKLLLQGVE